jgi:hypothetical protein
MARQRESGITGTGSAHAIGKELSTFAVDNVAAPGRKAA